MPEYHVTAKGERGAGKKIVADNRDQAKQKFEKETGLKADQVIGNPFE